METDLRSLDSKATYNEDTNNEETLSRMSYVPPDVTSQNPNYDIHPEGIPSLKFEEEKLRKLRAQSHAIQIGIGIAEEEIKPLIQGKDSIDLTPYFLTKKDSIEPSYTNLILPYTAYCRRRLYRSQIEMKKQLAKEMRQHEAFQNKALGGVRLHRLLSTCTTVTAKPEKLIKLTEKQKEKIELILAREY